MRRVLVASVLSAVLVLAGTARAPAGEGRSLEAYTGLGAWISIYDKPLWRDPEAAVASLAARGVHTLYLQTSNYRQRNGLFRADVIGRFLLAAHDRGIDVVAWYLPSLVDPALDLRRSLAAANYVSADGESFDSFALDVEATLVHPFALRNARTLDLAARVRAALPADEPIGAITIAPVGASPTYWPNFPFRGLSRIVDVFLPMEYFTARTRGAGRVGAYTAANVRVIRAAAGDPAFPIHAIGGETPHATGAEVRAFVRAAASCGAIGAGLWEFERTTAAEWAALTPVHSLLDQTLESDTPATASC